MSAVGVQRCPSKNNWDLKLCLFYGVCPLLGVSVFRGFTIVQDPYERHDSLLGYVVCTKNGYHCSSMFIIIMAEMDQDLTHIVYKTMLHISHHFVSRKSLKLLTYKKLSHVFKQEI